MRVIIATLFLAVLLCNCKKENNTLQQGVTYHRSGSTGLSLRVFAASGEITDAAIVSRFTIQDSSEISRLSIHLGTLDTIQIVDGNNAKLFENVKYSDFNYEAMSKDFKFHNNDTISGYSSSEVYTRTMNYYLCLYKPVVYSETIVSSTGGSYLFQYKGRKEYFIERRDNQLEAPWIVFTYHYAAGSATYSIQNRLDKNFYTSLQQRDTVVLREYNLNYE